MGVTVNLLREDEDTGKDIEYKVEVDYYPFIPGRYYGPPEQCYEDEGGFVELLQAFDSSGNEADIELTEKESQSIYEEITDNIQGEKDEARERAWEDRMEEKVCDQFYDPYDK